MVIAVPPATWHLSRRVDACGRFPFHAVPVCRVRRLLARKKRYLRGLTADERADPAVAQQLRRMGLQPRCAYGGNLALRKIRGTIIPGPGLAPLVRRLTIPRPQDYRGGLN